MQGVYYSDNIPHISNVAILTEKGERFLDENNSWSKLYKGLKELKTWISLYKLTINLIYFKYTTF